MRKKQAKTDNTDVQRITELVSMLNRYRHEYYNLATSSVSDVVYDKRFHSPEVFIGMDGHIVCVPVNGE